MHKLRPSIPSFNSARSFSQSIPKVKVTSNVPLPKIDTNIDKFIVSIKNIGDGFIYFANKNKLVRPTFDEKILYIKNWDKNAIYYNLTKSIFPNVEQIFIFGDHPCDPNVPWRFPNAHWYTIGNYLRYFKGMKHYNVLDDYQVDRLNYYEKHCAIIYEPVAEQGDKKIIIDKIC